MNLLGSNLSYSCISGLSKGYLEKFDVFKTLEVNSKIIVNNNVLELDNSWELFQPLMRWWYDQGRNNLCEYLQKEFDNYFFFFDSLKEILEKETLIYHKHKIINIINIHKIFMKDIITGITALRTTYLDDENVTRNITTIIGELQKKSDSSSIVDEID